MYYVLDADVPGTQVFLDNQFLGVVPLRWRLRELPAVRHVDDFGVRLVYDEMNSRRFVFRVPGTCSAGFQEFSGAGIVGNNNRGAQTNPDYCRLRMAFRDNAWSLHAAIEGIVAMENGQLRIKAILKNSTNDTIECLRDEFEIDVHVASLNSFATQQRFATRGVPATDKDIPPGGARHIEVDVPAAVSSMEFASIVVSLSKGDGVGRTSVVSDWVSIVEFTRSPSRN